MIGNPWNRVIYAEQSSVNICSILEADAAMAARLNIAFAAREENQDSQHIRQDNGRRWQGRWGREHDRKPCFKTGASWRR